MDINSVRLSRAWPTGISTVLCNAYALCNMCHLQVLKTCDSKIAEYTFPHLDSAFGLTHVMATEFIAADKKIWGAVSQLHAKGWTLEESIHESTGVRSDISSLLQPRPLTSRTQRRRKRERDPVTLCMKFKAGECKRNDCHYQHGCANRLQNGRPCMQNHAAKDHRGST